jgi:hypothetical protein
MKKIHFIISLFVLALFTGCTEDNVAIDLDAINAPENISALVTITQDNQGNVTFLPRGEGVSQYEIYFADGTVQPAILSPGATTTHKYAEGVYQTKIVGTTVNGKRTEVIQVLTVSFLAPTNLQVTVAPVVGDNRSITVKASANLETYFQVYFGDAVNEVPVDFMEGETITHKYTALGTYNVKIVALSGGAAKTEETKVVVISDPLLLPVTMETVSPIFDNFGGATTTVVANPSVSGINTSSKVGQLFKNAGSEVWAGTIFSLAVPIDFSSKKIFKVKVWSPKAGSIVKLKIENLADSNINAEVDATSTVANAWQELSFDFSGKDLTKSYQRIALFFDFGNAGTGVNYFFDDIQLVSGIPPIVLPLTFETPTEIAGNFGGATTITVDNPKNDANNASSKVGACTKSVGSQVWGGSYITLTDPINLTTQKKIKMKFWSSKAGIPVLLKLENLTTASVNKEVIVNSTVVGGWETLTFDFTSIDLSAGKTYQKVVFIFDNATAGNGTTFYFDDIQQSN